MPLTDTSVIKNAPNEPDICNRTSVKPPRKVNSDSQHKSPRTFFIG